MVRVEFTAQAEDDLAKIDKSVGQRVLKKLRWLAENFDAVPRESLSGQWQGVFKLRVGDYRVLYTISGDGSRLITVHFVRHRREVYKLY
ncbi:MAG TPA: type II toxin-antitoxin system RelE/ParE family toxin [Anaerolineae bacterium]